MHYALLMMSWLTLTGSAWGAGARDGATTRNGL